MKKIFLVLIFSFVFSGNAFAEKINLSCTEKITNTVLSFTINTDNKTVTTQGSNYDPYLYSNGVFTFMMKTKQMDYLYRLNRNTGVLGVKAWKKNEEEFKELLAVLFVKMTAEGKTKNDTDYILNFVVNNYDQKEDYTGLTFVCEKAEPKF